jgi:hypothetical protein
MTFIYEITTDMDSNNENGLEINEELIESNWDKVTDK